MSEPCASDYIEMVRKTVEKWPDEVEDTQARLLGSARRIAIDLLRHVDAMREVHRAEIERIKADRDALRDEVEDLGARLESRGKNH